MNGLLKDLIKKWRKDIVKDFNNENLYKMLIKYFTYKDDYIYLFNAKKNELFKKLAKNEKRSIKVLKVSSNPSTKSHYRQFFKKGEFIKQFIFSKNNSKRQKRKIDKNERALIINDDAFDILDSLEESSISNMVTSPPYYNVREYSQWKNLYSYLFDMYNIIIKSHKALIPGGVFLYNIGDIFDNDRMTVHSKMGERRIPLGAYTIFMFMEAGYELLDNILWDKGETQSNRHTNNGNFTHTRNYMMLYNHCIIYSKFWSLPFHMNREESSFDILGMGRQI